MPKSLYSKLRLTLASLLACGCLSLVLRSAPAEKPETTAPATSLSDLLATLNAEEKAAETKTAAPPAPKPPRTLSEILAETQAPEPAKAAPSEAQGPAQTPATAVAPAAGEGRLQSLSEVLSGTEGSTVSDLKLQNRPRESAAPALTLSEVRASLGEDPEPESNHPTPGGHGTAAHGKTDAHGDGGEGSEEVASLDTVELMNYAEKALAKGRVDMASLAYKQLLSKKMSKAQQRTVLLGFARTLKKKGELTKAVAVFERIVRDYPVDADTPEVYLDLGRCQRALGAYNTAITRFYSVINSTIKLPEDGANKYRQLAKTAQFEIAETYFQSGNYMEASRFYSRLRLLDLADVDRARAHFMAAYSLHQAKDDINAINQLRSYLELNPEDENVPEARYLLAVSLKRIARKQEAMAETVELLRAEQERTAKDPKRWAYWQRKTGNLMANELFDQGDFRSALMIYTTLVELSKEDLWRLPISYQMGLCFERLGRTDKAMETYQSIIDTAASKKGDDPRKQEYNDLSGMATWRLNQIKWLHGTEQKLNSLLPPSDSSPPLSTSKK